MDSIEAWNAFCDRQLEKARIEGRLLVLTNYIHRGRLKKMNKYEIQERIQFIKAKPLSQIQIIDKGYLTMLCSINDSVKMQRKNDIIKAKKREGGIKGRRIKSMERNYETVRNKKIYELDMKGVDRGDIA